MADTTARIIPAAAAFADRLRAFGVVPVVEIADAEAAVPLAEALLEGGIGCAEITFRTGAAAAAIAAIRRAVPEMTVGAGTILTPEQVNVARDAGAAFLVSPGFGPSVVRRAAEVGLPILPGACTPTEIQAALEAGIRVVKFFPAEAAGGIPYLRALTGPFRDVGFVPTGGIDAGNLAEYLAVPGVLACGGSWFVRKEWIAAGDFAAVTVAAREAAAIVTRARRG
jgi:2-dehydro-3-deoxyphosphogluconate aldolase/(4S)-4-hydroxy-2-oxoglutarate aldolase